MAIKIHHGPNGSYKTSGAIQDDLIPALKQGRYIITNIRGLTRERVFQVFPDTPSTLEIENLSLESPRDLEKMRTFPQWAPRGAFIIFDETQLVFLKSWRESDLKRFDFPGGPEAAEAADRPMNWLDGWTRHRHWNWDIVLTTPNIGYIRDDIRLTAEKAYLHSNLAVIGIKGRYKESQHAATENKPPVSGTIVQIKKIKQETFRLYDSTATGAVSDTIAGKSIFKQPKVLFFLALPPILLWSAFSDMGSSQLVGWSADPASVAASHSINSATSVPSVPVVSSVNHDSNHVSVISTDQVSTVDHPFAGYDFVVRGNLVSARVSVIQFGVIDSEGKELPLTNRDLAAAGYSVVMRGECVAEVRWHDTLIYARCVGRDAGRAAERLVQERSGSASITSSASQLSVYGISNTKGAYQ